MRNIKKYLYCLAVVILFGLVSCREKGSGEKTGERIDEIIDNVKEGGPILKKKGTLEKLGESIDNSTKSSGM